MSDESGTYSLVCPGCGFGLLTVHATSHGPANIDDLSVSCPACASYLSYEELAIDDAEVGGGF